MIVVIVIINVSTDWQSFGEHTLILWNKLCQNLHRLPKKCRYAEVIICKQDTTKRHDIFRRDRHQMLGQTAGPEWTSLDQKTE